MINKILLENFKAFRHAEIVIKPITILVGPNNGGKSSILQSIRLIQQTLRGSGTEVLDFRGLFSSGNFETIVHQNSKNEGMRFKFDFENEKYFDVKINKDQGKLFIENFSCNAGEFEYSLEDLIKIKDNIEGQFEFYKSRKIEFRPMEYANFVKVSNIKPLFYRDSFFLKIRPSIKDTLFESKLIKKLIVATKEDDNARVDFLKFLNKLYNLERMSSDFYQKIKQEFENVMYIGPIRATAYSSYEKMVFHDVGMTGEHAVHILANNPNVQAEVEKYLKSMDILNSLEIENFKKQKNFEVKIKTKITDRGVNLTDVGCGTTQILPIIVQSLIAQKESLTLIEQPEIHLHPKVQAELANLFINVATKAVSPNNY